MYVVCCILEKYFLFLICVTYVFLVINERDLNPLRLYDIIKIIVFLMTM